MTLITMSCSPPGSSVGTNETILAPVDRRVDGRL